MTAAHGRDQGDVEDTVIGVVHKEAAPPGSPDEDTVVRGSASALFPLVQPGQVEPRRAEPGRAEPGRAEPGSLPGSVIDDEVVATECATERGTADPGLRYHTIRIGTHEPILLDVPAYIGRRPSTPRITGGRHPRLIRVPSPFREVSSTHLEVRQEGSIVVITDLDSTNGTIVTSPGAVPLKLRQGESVVVAAGSVVDIGDDIKIVILPIPTPAIPEDAS